MTAVRGRIAPVATSPAIALALSWKPFVKSKIRGYDDERNDDKQLCHINLRSGASKSSLFLTVPRRVLGVLLATGDRSDKKACP
jgi:hypothetical protein